MQKNLVEGNLETDLTYWRERVKHPDAVTEKQRAIEESLAENAQRTAVIYEDIVNNTALKKTLEYVGISYESCTASYGLPLQHYFHEQALNILLTLPSDRHAISQNHRILASLTREAIIYSAAGFMRVAEERLNFAQSMQKYMQALAQQDTARIDTSRAAVVQHFVTTLKSVDPDFVQKLFDLEVKSLWEPAKLITDHVTSLAAVQKKKFNVNQVVVPWIERPLNEFWLLSHKVKDELLNSREGVYSRLLRDIVAEIKVDHLIFGIHESVMRKTGLRLIADNTFISKAGLIYGPDPEFGNRLLHVAHHLTERPEKPKHTVFLGDLVNLILLLDEAWEKRGRPFPDDELAYPTEMGRVIGKNGETIIRLVLLKKDTRLIKTAYPWRKKEK